MRKCLCPDCQFPFLPAELLLCNDYKWYKDLLAKPKKWQVLHFSLKIAIFSIFYQSLDSVQGYHVHRPSGPSNFISAGQSLPRCSHATASFIWARLLKISPFRCKRSVATCTSAFSVAAHFMVGPFWGDQEGSCISVILQTLVNRIVQRSIFMKGIRLQYNEMVLKTVFFFKKKKVVCYYLWCV